MKKKMLACENKCGADLGRAVEQGGGEDCVFRQRPQGGEAGDRPCGPSMAAQVITITCKCKTEGPAG